MRSFVCSTRRFIQTVVKFFQKLDQLIQSESFSFFASYLFTKVPNVDSTCLYESQHIRPRRKTTIGSGRLECQL